MSSYAADLAAIFSAPFEPTDREDDSPTSTGSPNATKEETEQPLMTSTPQVKHSSANGESQESTTIIGNYKSIDEGAGISEKETNVDGSTSGFPDHSGESSPKRSPTLNIAVNPLNAMANSIAEAFKKRSPSGSHASFVVSTTSGCRSETSLKYTPLTFDDEEQLPICSGTGNANLNANNNNVAALKTEESAVNIGQTRYGAASNRGGLRGSDGSGPFVDRISFRSPLSVFTICLCVFLVFLVIICLSAIAKKAKKNSHAVHHAEHPAEHPAEHHASARKHDVNHPLAERAHHLRVEDKAEGHPSAKVYGHHFVHHPITPESENQRASVQPKSVGRNNHRRREKIETLNHESRKFDYEILKKEMLRLSNSTNSKFLREWLTELRKQEIAVQTKMSFLHNLRKELERRPNRVRNPQNDNLFDRNRVNNNEHLAINHMRHGDTVENSEVNLRLIDILQEAPETVKLLEQTRAERPGNEVHRRTYFKDLSVMDKSHHRRRPQDQELGDMQLSRITNRTF